MGGLFSTYFSPENAAFVALHCIVAVICLVLVALWSVRIARLLSEDMPESETALNRLLAPLERFSSYFDFGSSAFIFVGLIGTMNGFLNGMPKLTQADYNFDDLQRALSTSAMGIAWSLIFNGLLMLIDFVALRPAVERMRDHVRGDALENSIREHLVRLDGTVLHTLATFDRSTAAATRSIDAWNIRIDQAQIEYQKILSGISSTAENFKSTYDALLSLPETVRAQLEQVFQSSNQSLQATLRDFVASVEGVKGLPQRLEEAIDKSFAQRKQVLDRAIAAYQDALGQQAAQLGTIFERTDKVPQQVAEGLQISGKAAESAIRSAMEAFLEELRRAVRETVQQQVVEMTRSAAELRTDADALRGKWNDILEREKAAMQDAMVTALRKSIEVVDQQRANLMRIESTLPESLAATFTSLIQETQQASRSLADSTTAHRESAETVNRALRDFSEELRASRNGQPSSKPLARPEKPQQPEEPATSSSPKPVPVIVPVPSAAEELNPPAKRSRWKRLFSWPPWRRSGA